MSIPPYFETPSKYLETAVAFLEEHNWIYRTSNTRILAEGVLDCFPADWAEYFSSINVTSLNQFPCGVILDKDKPPKTLQFFQSRLQELRPNHKEDDFIGTEVYFRGMSPKKLHEISRLSDLIGNSCKSNVDVLIDFGSGLGYLSEILHKQFQFNVLGLECDGDRVKTATNRQRIYFPSATTNVHYRKEMITENSDQFIVETVRELYPSIEEPRLGILGLHACADLSITSIKLFFKLNQIKVLTIMPCCYHKLEEASNCVSGFKHFPISEELCKITAKLDQPKKTFNKPFLRLACQQTVSRWAELTESEHQEHGQNMFLRAAVECLASEGESIIKSRKKYQSKKTKLKPNFKDVQEMYILQGNEKNTVNWRTEHEMKFVNILGRYENGASLSEGLTCLQTALQEVCENIVLLDRVCFMQERAEKLGININVHIRKITNDKLSPRSFALIAQKQNPEK